MTEEEEEEEDDTKWPHVQSELTRLGLQING